MSAAGPQPRAVGAEDHNPSPQIGERLRPEPAARLWERVAPFLDTHLRAGR